MYYNLMKQQFYNLPVISQKLKILCGLDQIPACVTPVLYQQTAGMRSALQLMTEGEQLWEVSHLSLCLQSMRCSGNQNTVESLYTTMALHPGPLKGGQEAQSEQGISVQHYITMWVHLRSSQLSPSHSWAFSKTNGTIWHWYIFTETINHFGLGPQVSASLVAVFSIVSCIFSPFRPAAG